jgi:hypothetical protein
MPEESRSLGVALQAFAHPYCMADRLNYIAASSRQSFVDGFDSYAPRIAPIEVGGKNNA